MIKWIFLSVVVMIFGVYVYFNFWTMKDTGNDNFSGFPLLNYDNPQKNVTLILTGDIMLGRTVTKTALEENDFVYPFRKVSEVLKNADLVFANLENPIIENCPPHNSGFKFCAPLGMIEGLKYAGVDVVSLANNHTLNYGSSGLAQTKKFLNENNISYTDNSLSVRQIGSLTFGFLGFNFVDKNITSDQITLIQAASEQVDILVLGVHWGVEYKDMAGPNQRDISQKMIKAGADVIAGHHPHWVQNVEYCDKNGDCESGQMGTLTEEKVPVYYSLGNFIFDQMWSEETKKGLSIMLTFNKNGKIVSEKRLHSYMSNWAQPEFVDN